MTTSQFCPNPAVALESYHTFRMLRKLFSHGNSNPFFFCEKIRHPFDDLAMSFTTVTTNYKAAAAGFKLWFVIL